jgi:hypothetical protein
MSQFPRDRDDSDRTMPIISFCLVRRTTEAVARFGAAAKPPRAA